MNLLFHASLTSGESLYGIGLLSRFPVRVLQTGKLPTTPRFPDLERRGALWASVSTEAGELHVVNTHLGLDRKERMLQVDALLGGEWTGHMECRGPAVLLGDFNAGPRSPAYKRLLGKFRDVQLSLAGWPPRRTWPSFYPLFRLDHIFVNDGISVRSLRVPFDRTTRLASDHLPLVAELEIPAPAPRKEEPACAAS
jgi:endonuclease/exonuclease/phosphatase family metal-dependent hydrolase